MQAYKIITTLNEKVSFWLNNLPIQKDEKVEIIVISSKELKNNNKKTFSSKDIKELNETISLPVDPLTFQKNIRNEW